jgi:hypothetical protein
VYLMLHKSTSHPGDKSRPQRLFMLASRSRPDWCGWFLLDRVTLSTFRPQLALFHVSSSELISAATEADPAIQPWHNQGLRDVCTFHQLSHVSPLSWFIVSFRIIL